MKFVYPFEFELNQPLPRKHMEVGLGDATQGLSAMTYLLGSQILSMGMGYVLSKYAERDRVLIFTLSLFLFFMGLYFFRKSVFPYGSFFNRILKSKICLAIEMGDPVVATILKFGRHFDYSGSMRGFYWYVEYEYTYQEKIYRRKMYHFHEIPMWMREGGFFTVLVVPHDPEIYAVYIYSGYRVLSPKES